MQPELTETLAPPFRIPECASEGGLTPKRKMKVKLLLQDYKLKQAIEASAVVADPSNSNNTNATDARKNEPNYDDLHQYFYKEEPEMDVYEETVSISIFGTTHSQYLCRSHAYWQ